MKYSEMKRAGKDENDDGALKDSTNQQGNKTPSEDNKELKFLKKRFTELKQNTDEKIKALEDELKFCKKKFTDLKQTDGKTGDSPAENADPSESKDQSEVSSGNGDDTSDLATELKFTKKRFTELKQKYDDLAAKGGNDDSATIE